MIIVDRPENVTDVCKRRLQSVFDHKQFGFSAQGNVYALTSPLQATGQALLRYPVIPLLDVNGKSFWVAVSLTFSPHLGRFRVSNVSVVFFEGERYDPIKTPLLRAEWDEWAGASFHAQPHWHVYQSPSESFVMTPAMLDDDIAPAEFGELVKPPDQGLRFDLVRIHCAMAASWHLEPPNADQIPFTPEELSWWLPRCILYTRRQLEYICT